MIEAEAVRNADGSVTIRTAQGDVRADLVRAQVAELLRAGGRVTVELRSPTASPPQLVVTVRGGAVAQPAVTTGASGPPPTVPLTVGRILQAVAVPGPSTAAALQAAAQPGGPGVATPPAPGQAPLGQAPLGQPPQPAATPGAVSGQAPPATPPAQSSPAQPPAPASQPPQTSGPFPTTRQAAATPAIPSQPAAAQPSPAPAALMAQSAYRNALGLSGRADQAPSPQRAAGAPTPSSGAAAAASAGGGHVTAGAGLAAAAQATPGGPQLPTGAVVTVRVLATGEEAARFLGARGTAPAAPATGSGGGPAVLAGTVAGVTQSGRPIVATPFGHLALNATSDLRIGDRVALDVLASRVGEMPTAERAAPLSVLAREWPALEGAMRALQEALGPQAAAQITQAMVRPSPQMTAALVFFMTALKGGDMRSWFGQDATRTLENAGRGGLLSALAEDFQTLQRATEPADNGWRAFLIPVVGEEKRPIRLLTRGRRRGKGEKDGGGAQDGTAFLVDLELSSLGPFRLDGLVRDDLVDLWIRTTKPLPGLIRHDIKALFDNTLDRTGIQGRLAFKATPVLPPLPVPDLEAGTAGDTESLFA